MHISIYYYDVGLTTTVSKIFSKHDFIGQLLISAIHGDITAYDNDVKIVLVNPVLYVRN